MNYGKKGIKKAQHSLTSKTIKLKKMCMTMILKLFLVAAMGVVIIGICLGFGMFKGILDSAPDITGLDVTPSGYATVVYDSKGNETTKLVAADSNRSYVTMSKIPENLANAFVAIEDERFYEHNGIDIKGIFRAGMIAVKNRDLSQGASTITQQLIKNNVFDNWTNESDIEKIKRKIQEQYLALELEKIMSKEDILELYMNSINLGQNTLGVQAASMRYFGKPVYQLNLSECAVIASITQNPSKYNPISHPDNNADRRIKVLNKMLEHEYISQAEYDEAMNDDVYERIATVNEETESNSVYTYFVDELTEQVLADLMEVKGYNETQAYNLLYSGGLSIYTTQDPDIQTICDEVFSNNDNYPADTKWYLNYALTIQKANGDHENFSTEMLKAYFQQTNKNFNLIFSSQEEAYAAIDEYKQAVMEDGDEEIGETVSLTPQPQVSITVEDQSNGYIVAMVGGRGTKEASRTLNRATNTTRQPGSTFKVLSTYAPALESGLTLASVKNDAPFNYANGRPVKNWWGSNYRGLQSLRYGIVQSANIITVKVLTQITPQLGFDYLKNFGFTTLVESRVESDGTVVSDIGQPLALGGVTDGVTNMELNAAYAAIANKGTYIKPKLYTKIVDHDGNVLIDNTAPETRQVIKETTAWLLTDAMEDVVTSGTGGSCNFGNMAIAGKTGTTSDYKDVWFAGYTPYYTATTWAGYDNNVVLSSSAEKALAKTLWKAVMSKIHEDLPYESFPMPSGIVTATVCSKSGKLPIAGVCDGTLVTEYFAEGTVPTETCDVHYVSNICAYTGLPACEECPFKQSSVQERIPTDDTAPLTNNTTRDENGNLIPDASATDPTATTDPAADPNAQGTTTQTCPHNAAFFENPNYEAILEAQRQQYAAALLAQQQAQAAQNQ